MQIHRINENETLLDIAEKYEISLDRIKENNSYLERMPPLGRELLILNPTRTYRAKESDTPTSVAVRFGIKAHTLTANNPSILKDGIVPGREYAIKYPTPPLGAFAANGYLFKRQSTAELLRILPFITYLTVGAYKLSGGVPVRLLDAREAVRVAAENSKVVLMRVYDGEDGALYSDKERRGALAEELVTLARAGGFRGITLSAFGAAKNQPESFAQFLLELRKNMIGCDLILFTECDESTPSYLAELADGSVFMYAKHGEKNPPSFELGERAELSKFADETESSKALIYLSCDAFAGERTLSYHEAMRLSGRANSIERDDSTLLLSFKSGKGSVVLESLENVKAKLELCAELGFMGIAFDVSCVPKEYLLLAYSLFSPVHYQIPYTLPM